MNNNKSMPGGARVRPPRLPRKAAGRDIIGGYVQSHERYTSLALNSVNLADQAASHPAFVETSFQQVVLINTEFEEMQLDDVRFSSCDFATAVWYKTVWHRVELVGCRMTGFMAGEPHFEDVLFKDCLLSLSQLRFATLKSVRFEHCDLSEADLLEANLSDVSFVDCNLRQAELTGTQLAGIDLSTCNIDGARLGPKELRGATLNHAQALALIEAMGITITTNM
ncbi:pentapeptide repeat-containing protein [Dictyobacter aurantiacus]|uniref:Pentapeptide repeat protein n=1 Tax=Dictyobacter aurantiacus TaxID=1936993 RepID=A0A401ZFU7_9CHLR|nr:pentapeptide repeat-containing protein [Dictyobacter aurantiacus]GCE05673.1 hypothetical protein KDAU_30020 [Dictyobacter aurantiacus]